MGSVVLFVPMFVNLWIVLGLNVNLLANSFILLTMNRSLNISNHCMENQCCLLGVSCTSID